MQFFAFLKGQSSLIGSKVRASIPAPAIIPLFKASARSCSFITPPLAVLTKYAVGFIFARVSLFIISFVPSFKGQCIVTTSEISRSSSNETAFAGAFTFSGERVYETTFIPKTSAISATLFPISPKPTIPIVIPLSS